MADISEKEFEEAVKNGISFKRCAFCNTLPIGEIDLPEYGLAIARIKCRGCRMFVGVSLLFFYINCRFRMNFFA